MGIHHRDLRAQREKLIDLIIRYSSKKRHRIIVVFDGWKDGGGAETSSVRGGVTVIYSKIGEKADSVIKRIISSERREWIVVTSDRDIASHAWSTGSLSVPSEAFAPFIETAEGEDRAGTPRVHDGGEDGREGFECRTGNAWRPSKRDKAIRRALGKL